MPSPITRTVNYGYGDADWGDLLTSYNGMTITYDEIGNPLTGRNGAMTWEHGRQLASMGEWQFTYDANGMRRTRTDIESGDIYRYFYTGGQLKSMRAETVEAYVDYTFYYDASGNPLAASYFVDYWGVGEYSGLFEGMFYYVTNAQGDVTALVSETGELLVTYSYDAWGNPVSTEYYEVDTDYGYIDTSRFVSHNPFRYRGYVYDTETGLYYLQSRYYDPEVGRFINADAFAATGQGLVGNNMFAYCGNNPVNYVDDSGYIPADILSSENSLLYTVESHRFINSEYSPHIVFAKKKPNMRPNRNKRKGSENRQPSGERERNVRHPDGEEHSRVPKGTGGVRRMQGLVGLLGGTIAIIWIVGNDCTGIGAADDATLIPAAAFWVDSLSKLVG